MATPARALTPRPLGLGPVLAIGGSVGGAAAAILATRDPVLALIAFAALGVVLASTFRPDYALLILVAAGPLEGEFQSGSTTSTLSVTKLAGALAFGSFFAHAIATRRRIRADASHLIVALLLVVALMSTVHSLDSSIAMQTTIRYASFVLMYWVVTQVVEDHQLLRRIAWVLVLSSSVAGFIGLNGFLAGHHSIVELRGTQANDLGFILATSLPFAFWLLGSRRVLRPFVLVLIGVLSTSLVFTFSRGALLGLAAGAVWQVVVERRYVRLLLLGALAATLAAAFVVQSNSSTVSTGLLMKQHVASENVSTRLQAWNAAANLATAHPFLGIGPGNFRDVYYEATGRPPGSQPQLAVAHNAYLDIAAELGFVALFLFLAYIGLAFMRLAECLRDGLGPPGLASIVRVSLVVACIGSLTLSEQYFPQFWLFGGLATAMWAERRLRADAEPALEVEPVERELDEAAVVDTPTYDLAVNERRTEERERRVRAQFDAIRTQQERLRRRAAELAEREQRLERERADFQRVERARREVDAELAARSTKLDARERRLVERERAAQSASRALDERAQQLAEQARSVQRENAVLAARSSELAMLQARERERVSRSEPADPPPSASPRRGRWTLAQLDTILRRVAHTDRSEAARLGAFTAYLRAYADRDGRLPASFDGMLVEVFGRFVERS